MPLKNAAPLKPRLKAASLLAAVLVAYRPKKPSRVLPAQPEKVRLGDFLGILAGPSRGVL
jgi:hypothetical protein